MQGLQFPQGTEHKTPPWIKFYHVCKVWNFQFMEEGLPKVGFSELAVGSGN